MFDDSEVATTTSTGTLHVPLPAPCTEAMIPVTSLSLTSSSFLESKSEELEVTTNESGSITPTTVGKRKCLDIQDWTNFENYLEQLQQRSDTIKIEAEERESKFKAKENDLKGRLLNIFSPKEDDENLAKATAQHKKALEDAIVQEKQKLIDNHEHEKDTLAKSIQALIKVEKLQPYFSLDYQENIYATNDSSKPTPCVLRYGINSHFLKDLIGTTLKSDVLHPIETELFELALKYLKSTKDADTYLKPTKGKDSSSSEGKKYENNVVLIDIFVRDKDRIKADSTKPDIPETHTITLWYKIANELNIIDPSNSLFSSNLVKPINLFLNSIPENKISVKSIGPIQIYGPGVEKLGYSAYNEPPKPRDCIDIAVKIGFELNELQARQMPLEQIEEKMLAQISNQKKIALHLAKAENTNIRTLQSSSAETRLIALQTLQAGFPLATNKSGKSSKS